jgi:hypothetical protein
MYGGLLALYVSQAVVNSSTHKEQICELLQGRVLFRGRPGSKDAWTAEEDQIAQMIELFGPIPASVQMSSKLSRKYLDEDGNCREYTSPRTASDLAFRRLVAYQAAIPILTARSSCTNQRYLHVGK